MNLIDKEQQETAEIFVAQHKGKIQNYVVSFFFVLETAFIAWAGITAGTVLYLGANQLLGTVIIVLAFLWGVLKILNLKNIVAQRIWLANQAKAA